MLTESQAWLKLAQIWKQASNKENGYYQVDGEYGLCWMIVRMGGQGHISSDMIDKMKAKIEKLPSYNGVSNYKWSFSTEEGKNQRIAYCYEQATLAQPRWYNRYDNCSH